MERIFSQGRRMEPFLSVERRRHLAMTRSTLAEILMHLKEERVIFQAF